MMKNNILKKTQTSADFDKDPELAGKPRDEQLLLMAKREFDRAVRLEHRKLLAAVECGRYLVRAKKLWKQKSEHRWLKKLRRVFDQKERTAQVYMQLAENWNRLEPVLIEYPTLSIDGALRYLKIGRVEKKKKKTWDPNEFGLDRQWAELKRLWENWPQEAKDWLRCRPGLLEDLLVQLVKENAPPKKWFKYGPRHLRLKVSNDAMIAIQEEMMEEQAERLRRERREREDLNWLLYDPVERRREIAMRARMKSQRGPRKRRFSMMQFAT
jgi:hypothetical protein